MAKRATSKDQDTAGLDVERGDEVYFRHKTGPLAGKVLSRGVHGVVVEHKGQRHQIHWGDLHGHKVKVRPEVSVVDQGEDGMIVQDKAGQRRFIRDPLGTPPAPITKSCRPAVLLFGEPDLLLKAAGKGGGEVAARPPEQRKPSPRKVGDKVGFSAPHEGCGEIVGAPGEHGAHVRDAEGKVHQVLYDHMRAPGDVPMQKALEPVVFDASDPDVLAIESGVAELGRPIESPHVSPA